MTMTKDEFLDHMGSLWDAGDRIAINLQMRHYRPRRKGVPTPETQALADRLGEMLAAREGPFGLSVVSVKDILELPEFRDSPPTATRVGRALALIGGVKGGQVDDGAGDMTSVWIVADHDQLVGAPRSRIEYVFQDRKD